MKLRWFRRKSTRRATNEIGAKVAEPRTNTSNVPLPWKDGAAESAIPRTKDIASSAKSSEDSVRRKHYLVGSFFSLRDSSRAKRQEAGINNKQEKENLHRNSLVDNGDPSGHSSDYELVELVEGSDEQEIVFDEALSPEEENDDYYYLEASWNSMLSRSQPRSDLFVSGEDEPAPVRPMVASRHRESIKYKPHIQERDFVTKTVPLGKDDPRMSFLSDFLRKKQENIRKKQGIPGKLARDDDRFAVLAKHFETWSTPNADGNKVHRRKSRDLEDQIETPLGYRSPTLKALITQAQMELRPPPPKEHKEAYKPVTGDAASMGRLTRLDEYVVEALGRRTAEMDKEEAEKSKKNKTLLEISESGRSGHDRFRIVHEAAALGNIKRLKPTVTKNYSSEGLGDTDDEFNIDDIHRVKQIRTNYLVKFHMEDHEHGKAEIWDPEKVFQENYTSLSDVPLPSDELPKYKLLEGRNKQLNRIEFIEAISKGVAEKSWDRRYRLERPNAPLKVTARCKCTYCKHPNPYQTIAYQRKEKGESLHVPLYATPTGESNRRILHEMVKKHIATVEKQNDDAHSVDETQRFDERGGHARTVPEPTGDCREDIEPLIVVEKESPVPSPNDDTVFVSSSDNEPPSPRRSSVVDKNDLVPRHPSEKIGFTESSESGSKSQNLASGSLPAPPTNDSYRRSSVLSIRGVDREASRSARRQRRSEKKKHRRQTRRKEASSRMPHFFGRLLRRKR